MQIAQIHESETDVRWQYPDDIKECKSCQKVLKANKDKVGESIDELLFHSCWQSVQERYSF